MRGGGSGVVVVGETGETDDVKMREFRHKVVSPGNSYFRWHQIYLHSKKCNF